MLRGLERPRAIELARDKNVDFADAVLALEAARDGETVCTFDKTDFKRLPTAWISPESLPH
jgi:predicted nucleic acid-binding protein